MTENSRLDFAFNGLLIDWLTLRMPVRQLPPSLQERLYENLDTVACLRTDRNGEPLEIKWESKRLNFDALRSDAEGLYFTCAYIGAVAYFYLGASPASLQGDCNVFGSLDIQAGADALLARARKAFKCLLAPARDWELVRLDVTGNYALPDAPMVKSALRSLLGADSARRKATSAKNGGDTVLWAPSSDVIAGKAYHKGPHLRHLVKKGQIDIDEDRLQLADRLLRLELRMGSRWFRFMRERRQFKFFGRHWLSLSEKDLTEIHTEFFGPVVEGVEVENMGRKESVELIAAANGITAGRATAAYDTYRRIKECGLDEVRAGMPRRTYFLHKRYLLAAGFSEADLCSGNVVRLKPIRIVLAQPVASWDDVRRAA